MSSGMRAQKKRIAEDYAKEHAEKLQRMIDSTWEDIDVYADQKRGLEDWLYDIKTFGNKEKDMQLFTDGLDHLEQTKKTLAGLYDQLDKLEKALNAKRGKKTSKRRHVVIMQAVPAELQRSVFDPRNKLEGKDAPQMYDPWSEVNHPQIVASTQCPKSILVAPPVASESEPVKSGKDKHKKKKRSQSKTKSKGKEKSVTFDIAGECVIPSACVEEEAKPAPSVAAIKPDKCAHCKRNHFRTNKCATCGYYHCLSAPCGAGGDYYGPKPVLQTRTGYVPIALEKLQEVHFKVWLHTGAGRILSNGAKVKFQGNTYLMCCYHQVSDAAISIATWDNKVLKLHKDAKWERPFDNKDIGLLPWSYLSGPGIGGTAIPICDTEINNNDYLMFSGYSPETGQICVAAAGQVSIKGNKIRHSISTMNGSCGSVLLKFSNQTVSVAGIHAGTYGGGDDPNFCYRLIQSKN
jgi:hypothetical protein